MSDKVTPWFDGDVKPVRVGYYERLSGSSWNPEYSMDLWTGQSWVHVYMGCTLEKVRQDLPWRGLFSRSTRMRNAGYTGRSAIYLFDKDGD